MNTCPDMSRQVSLFFMNRSIFLMLTAVAMAVTAMAQYPADGYYRVKNYVTKRYVYVTDDKGKIDMGATSADVNALQVWKGDDKALCDPASIIYFQKGDDVNRFDLIAQGTSVTNIIDDYVSLYYVKNSDTYMCYGKKASFSKYLADIDTSNDDMGIMSIDGTGESRKWYVTPVSASGDNYLGVKPKFASRGKYYEPYYTSFPYAAYSSGMKFYAVSRVQGGLAVIKEITGDIPAKVPVIVECSSAEPSSNRLDIKLKSNGAAPASNQLKGVFFNNPMQSHYNRLKFDPATMRGLSVDAGGNLVFTATPGYDFVPANSCYISVSPGSPKIIKVVTEDEFEAEAAKTPVSISLGKPEVSITLGESIKLGYSILPATASQSQVTWKSDNESIVAVSSDGTINGVAVGVANVTVETANGVVASCKVTVSKSAVVVEKVELNFASAKLEEGKALQLTASVSPANAENKTLVWSTSNPAVATVSQNGMVTALTPGNCEIVATAASGVKGVCQLEVTKKAVPVTSITLSTESLSLNIGDSHRLTATVLPDNADNRDVVWSTSNEGVVTVAADGSVTAVGEGIATVRATAGGVSASCTVTVSKGVVVVESVAVSQDKATLAVGDRLQLTATVSPANADNKTVTWTSSDTEVATVTSLGKVVAKGEGVAQITAACGGKSAVCVVTVKKQVIQVTGVSVTPTFVKVEEGKQVTLAVTIYPENADDKTVTWSTDDAKVATVVDGVVTGVARGVASITATASGYSATARVQVTARTDDSGVEDIVSESLGAPLYNLAGEVVIPKLTSVTQLRALPRGIYILRNRKIIL